MNDHTEERMVMRKVNHDMPSALQGQRPIQTDSRRRSVDAKLASATAVKASGAVWIGGLAIGAEGIFAVEAFGLGGA